MHRARGLLSSVLAGLLVVTGFSGCGDESTARTDPVGQIKPDAPDPVAKPPRDKPPGDKPPTRKKPVVKPIEDPPPPAPSDVDKTIEKLERMGVKVHRLQRPDETYEPPRSVWIANNNRHAREALKLVTKLTSIRFLHITGGSVGDADLYYLLPLENLESLKLRDTKITGQGLVYLQEMHKLRYLNLINTKVDDAGLKYLYGLKSLRILTLGGTRVTGKGAAELKKRLPKLEFRSTLQR
jgi:hypothetical protein